MSFADISAFLPTATVTLACAMAAAWLADRMRLWHALTFVAAVGSLVTLVNLLVLSRLMLLGADDFGALALTIVYSVIVGLLAALIVGHKTGAALGRLVSMASSLEHDRLHVRVGEVGGSRDLRLLAEAIDQATERLQTAIAMERAVESQRRDLMTSLSHDLRTPISRLNAIIEAIDDGVITDDDSISHYTGEIRRSIRALVAMIDAMFEIAQTDRGLLGDADGVELRQLVAEAVDLCWLEATEKQVTLDVELGAAADIVCSPQFARAIYSLLDNAVRYTEAGGHVSLQGCRVGETIEISVEDTGVGIGAEDLPRVFEPFWRADQARSTRGSGLGLTLARRISEALGGGIEVQSEPQRGSRFAVWVPVESATVAGRAATTVGTT